MTQPIRGTITTVAGNGKEALFKWHIDLVADSNIGIPRGVTLDGKGNVYFCDTRFHCVRRLAPDGKLTVVAGVAEPSAYGGYSGDGGQATVAELDHPYDTAIDTTGNIYIADRRNHRIRKVDPSGIITTVAGTSPRGYSGDGGQATAAQLDYPESVAVDEAGALYIADCGNHRIRKVTPDGKITTVAGDGNAGYSGDEGPAAVARLNEPTGVAVDKDGHLYIADRYNERIRQVTPDGKITTVAGDGRRRYAGDGVPATITSLNEPCSVAVDGAGNLYIADCGNHRVRKVTADGFISTIAGNGVGGSALDGAAATGTSLYRPIAVAVAPSGDLYIGDMGSYRVYKVFGASAVVPPTPPAADLYGKYVLPVTAPRGREFELGATIHNRGPATASGDDITVVLTLADGLESTQADTGRRLTRTFAGTGLTPHGASLDGVFRIRATDDAVPGVYESMLEIQYGGDLNLKNNTAVLPVTVVDSEPIDDERALIVYQDNLPKAAPGQSARFHLRFLAPVGQPVNPGTLDHRLTAPTGFVFTGRPTYTYLNTALGTITGDLDHDLQDDGRTLLIRHNPHLNTTDTDTAPLLYTLDLHAQDDATPGLVSDGSASIGQRPPVQIRAEVTDTTAEAGIRIIQTQLQKTNVKPGDRWVHPAVLKLTNSGQTPTGVQDLVLTAPEGLRFSKDAVGMWRGEQDDEITLTAERSHHNRTLTVQGAAALNINPRQWALIYPEMEVDTTAPPGPVRVGAQIGNPPIAIGHATVTICT